MVTRRQAREWAVMLLCQFDQNPPERLEDAIAAFWVQLAEIEKDRAEANEYGVKNVFGSHNAKHIASLEEMKGFAEERVRGVLKEREALDAELDPFLQQWPMYRLGTVERNVLRLGAWELSRCPEIPAPIAINEAVEIAKSYGLSKSPSFVNGILDKIRNELTADGHPQVCGDKGLL